MLHFVTSKTQFADQSLTVWQSY